MSTTIESRDRMIDILSLSYLGDLLREQLGDDAENYIWPDDFEKAVADIGFMGTVYRGEASPWDVIFVGRAPQATMTTTLSPSASYRSVRFVAFEGNIPANLFRSQTNLVEVQFPTAPFTIGTTSFVGCTSLEEVTADNAVGFIGTQAFANCTALKKVHFPKMTNLVSSGGAPANGHFSGCTSLELFEIGSEGYTVTAVAQNTFNLCTQSGLTITIYTNGSHADTLVSDVRRYATNATIIIKASEATTYNGTSYAAGDTILTSEVTS